MMTLETNILHSLSRPFKYTKNCNKLTNNIENHYKALPTMEKIFLTH